MKVDDALLGVQQLFLDTAPVIYFVERHPHFAPVVDDIFNRIDQGALPSVTSPITLAECLVMPHKTSNVTLQQDFMDLIVHGSEVTFRIIDESIANQAAELRARYNLTLADALQIATALAAGCDAFLTNDIALKCVAEINILVIAELEV